MFISSEKLDRRRLDRCATFRFVLRLCERPYATMLDNLSFLALENQTTDFPSHFHETYCISQVTRGVEQLIINDTQHYAEAGSITITQPYEVHAQPLMDRSIGSGFQTLYVSADVLKYYAGRSATPILARKINDPSVSMLHGQVITAMKTHVDVHQHLRSLIQSLIPFMGDNQPPEQTAAQWIMETKSFIQEHLRKKIDLDQLAQIAGMDKFSFSKRFRTETGLSPIHYVLMQKAYAAKARIDSRTNLTHLAYQFEFTDLAHFSHTFKRYVGLSPGTYKQQLKK